jgi:hypothetical protein
MIFVIVVFKMCNLQKWWRRREIFKTQIEMFQLSFYFDEICLVAKTLKKLLYLVKPSWR